MPIPTGSYTRQQIRDLALNRAGNRALDTDAIAWLAQLLFDLYTLWDWPFLFTSEAVAISGRTFALPVDFDRTQDETSLKPTAWDGQSVAAGAPIREVARESFDLVDDANHLGMPLWWTCDRDAGVGIVTPNPAGHTLTATLRYKRIPIEPAVADEPADVPVFPWHTYLVQAVYVIALEHEKDPRLGEGMAIREQMFAQIRRGSSPRHAQNTTIPLDPAVFRTPFQGD